MVPQPFNGFSITIHYNTHYTGRQTLYLMVLIFHYISPAQLYCILKKSKTVQSDGVILVRAPSIDNVENNTIHVPRVVRNNHDVVARTLPQEHEPRPEIEIAVGIEPDLRKKSILLLLVLGDVFQPLALCDHILGAPGMEPVG